MIRSRGEIVQTGLLGAVAFLPLLANATLAPAERAPPATLLLFVAFPALFSLVVLGLRVPRWVAFLPSVAGAAYASFVWGCGCDVSYHAISAVWETNADEVREFLGSAVALRSLALLAVVTALAGLVLVRRWRGAWASVGVRLGPRRVVAAAGIAAAATLGYLASGEELSDAYPARFVRKNLDYLGEVRRVRREYESLRWRYDAPPPPADPLTLVLLIGESARAANWSLYGYGRETNPEVRSLLAGHPEEAVLLDPAVPAGRVTRVSVPSMLSVAPAREFPSFFRHPTLLRVFRETGRATFVASAQLPTGYYEGLPNLVLGDGEVQRRVRGHDELLLPVLDSFLGDPRPVRLIVVQLMGSHLDYEMRYPPAFDRFRGGRPLEDAYDNSILYTDWVVARILDRLRGLAGPAAAFYVSDHGENLDDAGDGNFSHGARAVTTFEVEVPMLLYLNPALLRARPETAERMRRNAAAFPGHHDYVAPTFLGLAGLVAPDVYRPDLDLSSPSFDPPVPWFAENARTVRPYPDVPEARRLNAALRER